MAEGVLRHEAEKRGLRLEVDSVGTADYHVGESPDERAVRCLKHRGIDISHLRGRQFSRQDYDRFDHIFVMDRSNQRHVLKLAANDDHTSKVQLWLHHATERALDEVPDPYYGDRDGFDRVYEMIAAASHGFLDSIEASSR
jgi:protein-tyrosine phosphatase